MKTRKYLWAFLAVTVVFSSPGTAQDSGNGVQLPVLATVGGVLGTGVAAAVSWAGGYGACDGAHTTWTCPAWVAVPPVAIVPLAVHLFNQRRGRFASVVLTSALVTAGTTGLIFAVDEVGRGWPALLVANAVATIAAESLTARVTVAAGSSGRVNAGLTFRFRVRR